MYSILIILLKCKLNGKKHFQGVFKVLKEKKTIKRCKNLNYKKKKTTKDKNRWGISDKGVCTSIICMALK